MKRLYAVLFGLLSFAFLAAPAQAQTITIGTCGTGGYWFQSGTVLAQLINKYGGGVKAKAIPTACAIYNLVALGRGDIDIGLSIENMDRLAEAGAAPFAGKDTKGKIRFLTTWYTNYLHIYTLNPKIKTLQDLRGKRVAVGVPQGGTYKVAMAVFKADGLDPQKDMTLVKVNLETGIMQLKAGQIDAQVWDMPPNNPAMSELTNTRHVYFIPVPKSAFRRIPKKLALSLVTVPAKTYPNMDHGVPMVAGYATLVTRKGLSSAVVEKVLGALYGHLGEFYAALPSTARQLNKKNTFSGLSIPLHRGALEYFKKHDFPGLKRVAHDMQ